MPSFESIKALLDAMSTEDLISTGEYITQRLEKQLRDTLPTQTKTAFNPIEIPPHPSPLLHLPRELRDEILSYALLTHPTLHSHSGNKPHPPFHLPPLLHTSQQLRSETASLFFPHHTFVLWGDARFQRLAHLLSISGNVWNSLVRCVVLIPDESYEREDPWEVYDVRWAGRMSRNVGRETGLREGVVYTAMRRAGLGREWRFEVVGEGKEESVEMVVG